MSFLGKVPVYLCCQVGGTRGARPSSEARGPARKPSPEQLLSMPASAEPLHLRVTPRKGSVP